MMIAPIPTAPIGAASPSWPMTAVSTAPRSGTVAFESTIGTAMASTRRCVIPSAAATMSGRRDRHQEMPRRLREQARAVVLPGLDMDRGIAPPASVHPRPRIGIARETGAEIIHREVDRLRHCREAALAAGITAPFHRLPDQRPGKLDDCRDLEEGADRPAMQRRAVGIADQLLVIGQDRRQFIAPPVEPDAEELRIGEPADEPGERRVAPLLDHLNRFDLPAQSRLLPRHPARHVRPATFPATLPALSPGLPARPVPFRPPALPRRLPPFRRPPPPP